MFSLTPELLLATPGIDGVPLTLPECCMPPLDTLCDLNWLISSLSVSACYFEEHLPYWSPRMSPFSGNR